MSDSLNNFNDHFEVKKWLKNQFLGSRGFNFGQFLKSVCPIYFIFHIEKVTISDPWSYLGGIKHLLRYA